MIKETSYDMNTKSKKENIQLHECPECHLNYKEKEWMNKCEAWCKEHLNSCNLEITAHAIENENKKQK